MADYIPREYVLYFPVILVHVFTDSVMENQAISEKNIELI